MKRLLPILLLMFANEANAAVIWSFPPTEKAFFAIAILYLLNIHWWVITFVLAWLVCSLDNNSADRKSFEHRVFITVLACGVAIVILEHGVLKNQIYVWPLILVCVAMSLAANWARDVMWKKKSPSTSNEKKVTTSQVSSEKQSVVDASLPASTASEAMTIVRKTKTDTRSMGDGTTDTPRTSGSRAYKSNPDPLSSVEANKRAFKKIVQEVQREQKSLGSGETSVVDASLSASTASESIPNAGRDIKTLDDSKSHGAVEIVDHLPFGMPIGSKYVREREFIPVEDGDDAFSDDSEKPAPPSDSLNADWLIAKQYYPDIGGYETNLQTISSNLAYSFKTRLLENKDFAQAGEIAIEMEREFLETYFGKNDEITNFAKQLIFSNERAAARELNKAIRVLGPTADPSAVIPKIKNRTGSANERDKSNNSKKSLTTEDTSQPENRVREGKRPKERAAAIEEERAEGERLSEENRQTEGESTPGQNWENHGKPGIVPALIVGFIVLVFVSLTLGS